LEFNSTRKRMSVIVKVAGEDKEDSKVLLLCKGADSIIEKRLKKSVSNSTTLEKTKIYLEEYAKDGLRTLLLA
jgi:magnesium-transporting ATPase (P-type)